MSLVEMAAAQLREKPPGFVGSIATMFSESSQEVVPSGVEV